MMRLKVIHVAWILCLLAISYHCISLQNHQLGRVEKLCVRNFTKQNNSQTSQILRFKTTTTNNDIQSEDTAEEEVLHLIKRPKIQYLKVPNFSKSPCWKNKCLQNKETRWRMFTFVKSACENHLLRYSIRRTWGSIRHFQGGEFYTIFVIGKAEGKQQDIVEKEHSKYEDILQINVPENYSNLVYKSLTGLQWASENLSDEVLYSIVDDDMFVNIAWIQQYLLEVMTTVEELPTLPIFCMFGHRTGLSPIRKENSKYYCAEEEYMWPFWPDFCLGGMYTTSVEVARKLWMHSRTEPIVHLEDAWITGVLRQKLGMPKEMLLIVKPPAALHLASTSNPKQTLVSAFMISIWRKMQSNMNEDDMCICF